MDHQVTDIGNNPQSPRLRACRELAVTHHKGTRRSVRRPIWRICPLLLRIAILGKSLRNGRESERLGRTIDGKDFEKIMPLLHLAAMASDDELQTKWASLLESATTRHWALFAFVRTDALATSPQKRHDI